MSSDAWALMIGMIFGFLVINGIRPLIHWIRMRSR